MDIEEAMDSVSIKRRQKVATQAAVNMVADNVNKSIVGTRGPRLASIGLPVGNTKHTGISEGEFTVMPDGATFKEIDTSDISSRNANDIPNRVVGEISRLLESGIPNQKVNKMLGITQGNVASTRYRERYMSKGSGEYKPGPNLIIVDDKAHSPEGTEIVGDHEWNHAVHEKYNNYVYRNQKNLKSGDYQQAVREKMSNAFSARKFLPKQYQDTNSPDFVHPMASYTPSNGTFENVSDAYAQAGKKSGWNPDYDKEAYSAGVDDHVNMLNERLKKDPEFKKAMDMAFDRDHVESQRIKGRNISAWGAIGDSLFGE